MPRYESPIATSLADAFAFLGQSYAQKLMKEKELERQQGLLNQVFSQKDPRAKMPASQMTGNLEEDAFQRRPAFDERNLGLLMQLDPNVLNLMSKMQPQYDIFGSPSTGMGYSTQRPGQVPSINVTVPPMRQPDETWDVGKIPETYQIPGTDDIRVWEYRTIGGKRTGERRLSAGGSPPRPMDTRGIDVRLESALRKDFNNDWRVKVYKEANQYYKNARDAYNQAVRGDRIAADQALVTTINKLLDPQSVVRESEYARTPAGAALINRIEGWLESLTRGGLSLKDSDRKAILETIKSLHDNSLIGYKQARSDYETTSKTKGLVPFNVVGSEILSPDRIGESDTTSIGRFKIRIK